MARKKLGEDPVSEVEETELPPEVDDEPEEDELDAEELLATYNADENPTFDSSDFMVEDEPGGLRRFGAPREKPSANIPIWNQFYKYKGKVEHLRVYRDEHGQQEYLGPIRPDADEAAVIKEWPVPGRYWLHPSDASGKKVAQPFVFNIADDNTLVAKIRRQRESGGLGGSVDVYGMLEANDKRWESRFERLEAMLDQARQEAQAAREAEVKTKLAVAEKRTDEVVGFIKGISKEERERETARRTAERELEEQRRKEAEAANEARVSRDRDYYDRLEADRQRKHEERMSEIRADSERREREANERIEAEKLRLAAEEKRLREEARERRESAERAEKDRQAWMEREETRRQEHHAMLLKMVSDSAAAKDPFGSIEGLVLRGGALLQGMGIEPKDAIAAFRGGAKSIPELVAETVTTAFVTNAEIKKLELKEGAVMHGDEEEIPEDVQEAIEMLQARGLLAGPTAGEGGAPTQGAPQGPQTAAPQTQAPQDPVKALPAGVRKQARKAFAQAVESVASKPEAEWHSALMTIFAANTQPVMAYAKAAGLRTALGEAGADEQLANKIIATVQNTGLVPMDVPL